MEWYSFALISALFSATAAISEKKALFKEGALPFSTLLSIFNLFLSIPFFLRIDFSTLSALPLAVLLFKSILGALAFLCVMSGIKNLELSGALPLLVLTPGIVAFIAFILLNEALSFYEISGMALLLTGTYILQISTMASLTKRPQKGIFEPFKVFYRSKGHRYIIGALLLFTVTSILDKALLGRFKTSINVMMGFQHLFLAIVFFAFFSISTKSPIAIRKTLKQSGRIIFVIALLTIVYRYSHFLAVKAGPIALVLSIKRTSIFFATVIGGKIFHESYLMRKAISTAMMVGGAILIILF